MTKQCELCALPARLFCESDQANLCWECDAKVHGANFLVARHCRRLLCRSCQAPTPWRASGSRLGSTVSVCNNCLGNNSAEASDCCEMEGHERGGAVEGERRGGGNIGEEHEVDGEDEEDDDEEEEDFEEEEEEEDGDNQVVPWSTEADEVGASSPPPPASCSSSDESSSGRAGGCSGFLKRRREDDDLRSSDWREDAGCSPQHGYLRFSAAAAPYPGRMLEEEDDDDEDAPYSGCLEDRIRAVRHRPEPAGLSAPPRPPLRRALR